MESVEEIYAKVLHSEYKGETELWIKRVEDDVYSVKWKVKSDNGVFGFEKRYRGEISYVLSLVYRDMNVMKGHCPSHDDYKEKSLPANSGYNPLRHW